MFTFFCKSSAKKTGNDTYTCPDYSGFNVFLPQMLTRDDQNEAYDSLDITLSKNHGDSYMLKLAAKAKSNGGDKYITDDKTITLYLPQELSRCMNGNDPLAKIYMRIE